MASVSSAAKLSPSSASRSWRNWAAKRDLWTVFFQERGKVVCLRVKVNKGGLSTPPPCCSGASRFTSWHQESSSSLSSE